MSGRGFGGTESDGRSQARGCNGDFVKHFDGLVEAGHGSDFGVACFADDGD
jgi:hypothetical protein